MNSQINLKYQSALLQKNTIFKKIIARYQLYLFLLPTMAYFIVFHYIPMYGVVIAFKNFKPYLGIENSQWVGLMHFERFLHMPQFWAIVRNTVVLGIYSLIAGFPVPILIALSVNYIQNNKLKRAVQTITYAPHFISTVVLVGMITVFFSPTSGLINQAIQFFGGKSIMFTGDPLWFPHIYVWSGVWQNAGWGAIIYLAALAGIDQSIHEAAIVDGASKWQRVLHIDIPGIMPTIITLFILNIGKVMSVGFEKTFLMQNSLNISTAEIISTYVYQVGLVGGQFSFSSAVGLFNSLINLMMLIIFNHISKKVASTGLW